MFTNMSPDGCGFDEQVHSIDLADKEYEHISYCSNSVV